MVEVTSGRAESGQLAQASGFIRDLGFRGSGFRDYRV